MLTVFLQLLEIHIVVLGTLPDGSFSFENIKRQKAVNYYHKKNFFINA